MLFQEFFGKVTGFMKIFRSIRQMQSYSFFLKSEGIQTGFVPTMGSLHEGHISLVRRSKKSYPHTIASIFVNPLQFGPREDLNRYPREEKSDIETLRNLGVVTLFIPKADSMYPVGFSTYVSVEEMSAVGEGISRPTHFRVVTTVVMKLLNIVQPSALFLGQKDIQQALIIKRMIRDMDISSSVEICPTKRDKNGLALSSRNVFLSEEERKSAVALVTALRIVNSEVRSGETSCNNLKQKVRSVIRNFPKAELDYILFASYDSFTPVKSVNDRTVAALAAFVGKTRLIDNVIVTPPRR